MNYPRFNEELKYPAYTKHDYIIVQEWCNNHIGLWNEFWYKLGDDIAAKAFDPEYTSTYFFKTKQHQLLFKLRWS